MLYRITNAANYLKYNFARFSHGSGDRLLPYLQDLLPLVGNSPLLTEFSGKLRSNFGAELETEQVYSSFLYRTDHLPTEDRLSLVGRVQALFTHIDSKQSNLNQQKQDTYDFLTDLFQQPNVYVEYVENKNHGIFAFVVHTATMQRVRLKKDEFKTVAFYSPKLWSFREAELSSRAQIISTLMARFAYSMQFKSLQQSCNQKTDLVPVYGVVPMSTLWQYLTLAINVYNTIPVLESFENGLDESQDILLREAARVCYGQSLNHSHEYPSFRPLFPVDDGYTKIPFSNVKSLLNPPEIRKRLEAYDLLFNSGLIKNKKFLAIFPCNMANYIHGRNKREIEGFLRLLEPLTGLRVSDECFREHFSMATNLLAPSESLHINFPVNPLGYFLRIEQLEKEGKYVFSTTPLCDFSNEEFGELKQIMLEKFQLASDEIKPLNSKVKSIIAGNDSHRIQKFTPKEADLIDKLLVENNQQHLRAKLILFSPWEIRLLLNSNKQVTTVQDIHYCVRDPSSSFIKEDKITILDHDNLVRSINETCLSRGESLSSSDLDPFYFEILKILSERKHVHPCVFSKTATSLKHHQAQPAAQQCSISSQYSSRDFGIKIPYTDNNVPIVTHRYAGHDNLRSSLWRMDKIPKHYKGILLAEVVELASEHFYGTGISPNKIFYNKFKARDGNNTLDDQEYLEIIQDVDTGKTIGFAFQKVRLLESTNELFIINGLGVVSPSYVSRGLNNFALLRFTVLMQLMNPSAKCYGAYSAWSPYAYVSRANSFPNFYPNKDPEQILNVFGKKILKKIAVLFYGVPAGLPVFLLPLYVSFLDAGEVRNHWSAIFFRGNGFLKNDVSHTSLSKLSTMFKDSSLATFIRCYDLMKIPRGRLERLSILMQNSGRAKFELFFEIHLISNLEGANPTRKDCLYLEKDKHGDIHYKILGSDNEVHDDVIKFSELQDVTKQQFDALRNDDVESFKKIQKAIFHIIARKGYTQPNSIIIRKLKELYSSRSDFTRFRYTYEAGLGLLCFYVFDDKAAAALFKPPITGGKAKIDIELLFRNLDPFLLLFKEEDQQLQKLTNNQADFFSKHGAFVKSQAGFFANMSLLHEKRKMIVSRSAIDSVVRDEPYFGRA